MSTSSLEVNPVATLEAANGLFRFATAGSVDDGKSTLVGRLLHDSKSILVDQLESVARTSAERGFGGDAGGLDLALLTDGLRAEREQGITIDVAYRYFSTSLRSFILADCPGHVQYTRNMVTGAATADAVIVLIDARNGVLEQTRRHLSVVQLLRVPNVIVAVNKIDLVGYSQDVFNDVLAQLAKITDELKLDGVHAIPVSALVGDNVVERSEQTSWYEGPTLLELLETLPAIDDLQANDDPFRLPVQYVLRPQGALAPSVSDQAEELRDYRGYLGQISSGSVSVGDSVELFPGGFKTTVTGIAIADKKVETAFAPQSIALELADQFDLARGAVIAAAGTLAEPVNNLSGELFWLDPRPLVAGQRLLFKTGTVTTQVMVSAIEGRRNLDTLAIDPADKLEINDIGHASLRLAASVPIDDYAQNRRSGAFLLIHPQDGATMAAGIHTAQNDFAI